MNVIRRPLSFVLYATGHGTLIVNQNDYHRWESGYEYGVGLALARHSYFDPEEIELALRLLRLRREHFGDGVVALDCGANIGVHSVEWAREMYGWGRVHAFEAQEPIYYALCGNLVLNNCLNADAKHLAVGAESGTIRVPKLDYHKPGSFGSLELRLREGTEYVGQDVDYTEEAGTPVPLVTIDSMGFERVDFLKIDVEGMELEVLSGAKHTIETCKPIVFLEYVKSDSDELLRYFRSLSYSVYQMGINLVLVHEDDPSGIGII
jgi:FkbM family methyltransferase